MGFSRHYLKEYNFVFTRIYGEINDENLLHHVMELNKETEGMSDLREFADCREITDMGQLTVNGTTDSAQLENNRPDSLLALLVSDSPLLIGMSRAYQTFSESRRKETKIFRDINEALSWLSNSDDEVKIFYDFINMHGKVN